MSAAFSFPSINADLANSSGSQQLFTPASSDGAYPQPQTPAMDGGESERHFIEALLPHVKVCSYAWVRLQHEKREMKRNAATERQQERLGYVGSAASGSSSVHQSQDGSPPTTGRFRDPIACDSVLMERKMRMQIEEELVIRKKAWATRLLTKLRKDINPECRDHFVRSITNTLDGAAPECVMTNGDVKGKMRRIDCFRQSNKVWRLDLVTMVLFQGVPLESTDGERLGKVCNRDGCVQPHHLYLNVKEIDMVLAKMLTGAPKPSNCQLYHETKSAYDIDEVWNNLGGIPPPFKDQGADAAPKAVRVDMSGVDGFSQQATPTYTAEAMSVSPTGTTATAGSVTMGRTSVTASVPIPAAQAYKRTQSSFDEDNSDMDAISESRVGTGYMDNSHVGSIGSADYHVVSSPKIKAEATSPHSSLHQQSAMSMSYAYPRRTDHGLENTEFSNLSCSVDHMLVPGLPHGLSSRGAAQPYLQRVQYLPTVGQMNGQQQQQQQQQQQHHAPALQQLRAAHLQQQQQQVHEFNMDQLLTSNLVSSLSDSNTTDEAAHWSSQSSDHGISPMPALEGHNDPSSAGAVPAGFFSTATTADQANASSVGDASSTVFDNADLFGGRPVARSMPVGTNAMASSGRQVAPNDPFLSSPSSNFSQWSQQARRPAF